MPAPSTPIEPGTPAHRVASHLKLHPTAELTRADMFKRFDISSAAVDEMMAPALYQDLITTRRTVDGPVWLAGPKLAAWGATSTTKPRRVYRPMLPALDPAKLPAVQGPPPDGRCHLVDKCRHDPLFDSLTADGMGKAGIPTAYLPALRKAAQVYLDKRPALKAASSLLVRRCDDGTTCGVWRVARAKPTTALRQAA